VTGATARKDDDDDASRSGGMSDAGSQPAAVAAGTTQAGTAGGGSAGGVSTGIPPLDKAISALPVDDQVIEQHPEFLVGGAFVTGLLLAKLLKAIGG
jgi:hypothetical protein